MGIFVVVLTAVLLISMWMWAEVEIRTKFILTLLYGASWGLTAAEGFLATIAQGILSGIMWFITFGGPTRR